MGDFKSIFDNPHCISIMDSEISKKCCNIANQYRTAVRVFTTACFYNFNCYLKIKSTTLGEEHLNLDEAILELGKKVLLGGALKITHEHKDRVAILVCASFFLICVRFTALNVEILAAVCQRKFPSTELRRK